MRKLLFIFCLAALCLPCMAQTEKSVEVKKGGTLGELLSDDEKQSLTALTVSGRLNSADVKLLRRMAGANSEAGDGSGVDGGTPWKGQLRHLDLSKARFENDDSPFLTFRPGKNYKIRVNLNRVRTRNRKTGELRVGSRDEYLSDLQERRTDTTRRTLADNEATRKYDVVEEKGGLREFLLRDMTDKDWNEITRHDWNKHSDHYEERLADSTFQVGCHTAKHWVSYRMFSDCTSLETIRLGDDIENIGNYAFSGCTALTEITIPKRVAKISATSFRNTPSLRTVAVSEDAECQPLRLPDAEVISRYFTRSAPDVRIVRY